MTVNRRNLLDIEPSAASDRPAGSKIILITPVDSLIGKFPTTRYYGSKRKLLPWIFEHLKSLRFTSALDAFGGTGSVTQLFRAMRKDVTYHDGFHFNSQSAIATLTGTPALTKGELEQFLSCCVPNEGVVARNFAGVFFLPTEDRWIDGFMEAINRSPLSYEQRCLLLHLLYQACLKKRPYNLFHRSNLALRTRTGISRSFGNATTWEKPFEDHILQCFAELDRLGALNFGSAHILPAGDVMDLPTGSDLVYLDPPYVSERGSINEDGYWRRYHFLEGLSKYAEWENRIDRASAIRLMQPPAHFNEWSNKATSKEKLFELIRRHKKSTVVLSYIQGAYPEDTEIKNYFEDHFPLVSLHLVAHNHALSRHKRRELLFVGRPE